jgi:hypothetical protein
MRKLVYVGALALSLFGLTAANSSKAECPPCPACSNGPQSDAKTETVTVEVENCCDDPSCNHRH